MTAQTHASSPSKRSTGTGSSKRSSLNQTPCARCQGKHAKCEKQGEGSACNACITAEIPCITPEKQVKIGWHISTEYDMKKKCQNKMKMKSMPNVSHHTADNDPLIETPGMSNGWIPQGSELLDSPNNCHYHLQGYKLPNIINDSQSHSHTNSPPNYLGSDGNVPIFSSELTVMSPELHPISIPNQPYPAPIDQDYTSLVPNQFEVKIRIQDKRYRRLSILKKDMEYFVIQSPGILGPSLKGWLNSFIPEGSSFYWLEVDLFWQDAVSDYLGPGHLVLT